MIDLTKPVVVLTGAGVSADSGIPTFRGAGGLWQNLRATDLATFQAFQRDPKLVWEFYNWRRERISACLPNSAHHTIAAMEQALLRFTLITQNIDGLHQRAGSRTVLPLHGDIWHVRCAACDYRGEDRRVPLPKIPPRCPQCGSLLRPDVVWFGEGLPRDVLANACAAASHCALMIVVGTSAMVQPAASLPLLAQRHGAILVEINPSDTPLSRYADERLQGRSCEMLPSWWRELINGDAQESRSQ